MAPFSQCYPKEMVPVGVTPALFWICQELLDADVKKISVVLSPEKEDLSGLLIHNFPEISFTFITQDSPLGLADALLCAYKKINITPVHMVLPDNLCIEPGINVTRELTNAYTRVEHSVLGMIKVTRPKEAKLYGASGIGKFSVVKGNLYKIEHLQDKQEGPVGDYAEVPFLRTIGRGVLTEDFFDIALKLSSGSSNENEFDDVPIYQQLIADFALFGYLLPEMVYDIGNPDGYLAAQANLAQQRGVI